MQPKDLPYRRKAFAHYKHLCAWCGFGIPDVLQACHIDQNRENNDIDNLVLLCPTHHDMMDFNLIDKLALRVMRDRMQSPTIDRAPRNKDAAIKAGRTRSFKARGRKAARTRRANREAAQAQGAPVGS